MSSTFGQAFRITTFGESHGGGVGVVVDGCPPRLAISIEEIQRDLDRRRPGQSHLTTPRQEADRAEILSGVFEGQTLGTPIAILVRNQDARPAAYEHMKDVYRPSHADYTYEAKYGIRNWQGGGRASARETIGRVAAGADRAQAARDAMRRRSAGVGLARARDRGEGRSASAVTLAAVEANPVRCPDRRGRRGDGAAHRRRAAARRLARRRGRVRRARRAGRTRRAGLRQARGRAREGADVAARVEGLRDRQRLRRHAADRHRAQRPLRARRRRPAANAQQPLGRRAGRHHATARTIVVRVAFKPTATIRLAQDTVDRDGQRRDARGPGPPRSLRAAARGADGRGDGAARARRSLAAAARVEAIPR